MSRSPRRVEAPGPFRVDQLRPGDRYELHEGHAIYCAPMEGDGARRVGTAFEVLDSDPAVESAGTDAGFALRPGTLRAPDVSVGGVPDRPGWIQDAVPPLVVEYAGVGQEEDLLREKIADLLAAGTRFIWVVRLVGLRRVEIHEPGQPVRTVVPGDVLLAPGILQNSVPVAALFDRDAAHEVTLRNLLQRRGYQSLDAVKTEGRAKGLREAILQVLAARAIPVDEAARARIAGCTDDARLSRWIERAATSTDLAAILE